MPAIPQITNKAKSFLEKTGNNYYATVFAGDNISQNRIDTILDELKKVGMTKVKFRKLK